MNQSALIIYNPNSGTEAKIKIVEEYQKILNGYGYKVSTIKTEYPNHATDIIQQVPHYDIVFAVGGDGTLNEVITGNYKREDKLNICPLPSGTCNDVATMLGYTNSPTKNMENALEGELHDLDIGLINNHPFIYVVGMGKFMNIPYEVSRKEKKKMGYLAYLKSGAREALSKMKRYRARIIVDGVTLDSSYSLIMVSNSSHIAGIDKFHRDVILNDGAFEILLCKSNNIVDMVANFICYFTGKHPKNITSMKGRTIEIELFDSIDKNWCIDGEKFGDNGKKYKITAGAKMRILTPKLKKENLFI